MNSEKFLSLVKNGNQLDNEDFKLAIKLHENFPFFLIPKILSAKYEMEHSQGKSKELLHWAAVLSPDRKRLKQLIEGKLDFVALENEEIETPAVIPTNAPPENITDEKLVVEPEEVKDPVEKEEETPEGSEAAASSERPNRNEILRRLEENLNKIRKSGSSPESDQEGEKKKSEDLNNPETVSEEKEDLISAIKRLKKKKISQDTIKNQNKIIKNFNEKPIRLPKDKIDENESLPDLSENSTALRESAISESFARLLVKQHKLGEAKEIYQKLILMFPEKKAYFADRIAELKV